MEPLELELPWPPTVNDHWQSRVAWSKRTGKAIVHRYLSGEGKRFRKNVQAALMACFQGLPPKLDGWLEDTITLYPPDRRIRDPDNYVKPIHDALAEAGLVHNDRQFARTTNGWQFGDAGEIVTRRGGRAVVVIGALPVAASLF